MRDSGKNSRYVSLRNSPSRLRLDFLDLRGDSRARGPKTDGRKKGVSLLPSVSQAELLAMSGIQSLLLRNDELREVTLEAIEVEKERI